MQSSPFESTSAVMQATNYKIIQVLLTELLLFDDK